MLDHARRTCLSTAINVPRASVPSSSHSCIDRSLKELRTLSRRSAAVASPYSQELQILERIYYKGKNQHRSALFWRKVVEVRRLALRVNELNLHDLLEDLRSSFHITQGRNISKSLKSAWTHVPDPSTCKTILKITQSACFLIDQARFRFRIAYQSFIVQLRTAAFLPLILSLVAITSRLDFLLAEVRSIMLSQWEAVMRVVEAIDSNSNFRNERGIQLPSLPIALSPLGENLSGNRPRKKARLSDKAIEDLGSKVDRGDGGHSTIPTAERSYTDVSVTTLPPFPSDVQVVKEIADLVDVHPLKAASTPSAPNHSTSSESFAAPIPSTLVEFDNSKNGTQPQPSRDSVIGKKKKVKTKAKRRRDEIDDIFGF